MSKPLIPGGFIILSRKIIESEIWNKPPLYIKVWIYLLTLAQHKNYKDLKRGELRTSIPEIIEACKWQVGARVERPTKDQIYRILDWLRKPDEHPSERDTNTTMITTTKATHGIVIKVDNYAFYQDISNYEHNDEHNVETPSNTSRTQRQRDNINKNVKNVKNDKKEKNKELGIFETYTSNTDLAETLESFLEFRKKIKKPMTDRAITLLLNKLDELASDENEKIAILEQSILNGWQGVFELKGGERNGFNRGSVKTTTGANETLPNITGGQIGRIRA